MAIKLDLTKFEGVGNNQIANKSNIANDILNSDLADKIKGYAEQAANGFLAGQAPHIVGAVQEYGNLRNKIDNLDYKGLVKDFGKTYLKGRENTKKELNEFREENPYSSTAAEILGGIGSGGAVSSMAKSVLKKAILRAMAEGSLYGGLYGASNTEGKGFDLLGATIGTIAGGAGGAALGTLGKLAKKALLSNRKDKVITSLTPNGVPQNIMENIVEDKNVAKAVAGGDIGKKVKDYSKLIEEKTPELLEKIQTLKNEAYNGIDDKTIIDLGKTKGVESIEKAINKVEQNIGSDTESQKILNGAKSVLEDIKKSVQNQPTTRKQMKGGILKDYETVTDDILQNPDRQVEIVKIPRQEITNANYEEELGKVFSIFDTAPNGRKMIVNYADDIIADVPSGAKGEIISDLINIKNPELQNAAIHQIRNMQQLFYKAQKISQHADQKGRKGIKSVSRYATPFELLNSKGKPELYKAKFTVREFEDGRKVVSPEILELNKGKDYGLYSMNTYGTNKNATAGLGASKLQSSWNSPQHSGTISIGDLADFVNTHDNKIELGKLKNLKDRIYRLKNSAYKTELTGDKKRLASPEAIEMLDNIYNSLAQAEKEHSPQLKQANEFFSDMKQAKQEMAKLKLLNDNAAKNVAKYGRDNMGGAFEIAEKKVKSILGKHANTKGLADDLFSAYKQEQAANALKPISSDNVFQTPIKILKNIATGGNREQKMQTFAQAVLDGKITKEMLNKEMRKGRIGVAPLINYYLALSKVPQANLASAAINKVLPKNSKQLLESVIIPRLTIRNILDRYYNKEQSK